MPHGDGLLAYRYITELAARGHELVVAIEGSAIRGDIPKNIKLVDVGVRTDQGRLSYLKRVRAIFRAEHARAPFDLVHQLNPVFLGLSLALIGLRIPNVLGPYVASWPSSGGNPLRRLVIKTLRFLEQAQATHIILAGAQARGNIAYPAVPSSIIPYGIDVHEFAPIPLPAIARPTIIFMGPLAHRKGIVTLIHALELVRQHIPDVLIRIAGTGEDRDEMMQTIAMYHLESHVEIMGSIPRIDVPQYLASGHLLCQPSVGEPYGMSIVEAMAVGRPIVATAAGGFLDTVDTPAGGILVPVHDTQALADALIVVLRDTARAREMGIHNIARAESFDWTHVIDKLEDVYAKVLAA